MAGTTLDQFLSDRGLLAVKIPASALEGFFRKSFTVPHGVSVLARFADGSAELVHEGGEISGTFDGVAAKRAPVPIPLSFPDLRTSDGFALSAVCTVTLQLVADRMDFFRDFCRTLFTFPGTFGTTDLERFVAPETRRALAAYVSPRSAGELHRADHLVPAGGPVRDALERHLFDAGMKCTEVADLRFVSAEYEQRAASEKRKADELRRSAELMDRKEKRVRRLATLLRSEDVQGLLTRVPDERLKGLLYARLMEDDSVQLTAQELLSRAEDCGEEVVQVIYKAMENLLSHGATVGADEVETVRAGKIYAVGGHKVLEIDPADDAEPRIHEFPEALRSTRLVDAEGGPLLLGGAKRSVLALPMEGKGDVLHFPLPGGRTIRGGVNAIATYKTDLYATHSEYGLARWDLREPDADAGIMGEEITRSNRTTRAVQVTGDGVLFFASGSHVYSGRPDAGAFTKYVSSAESPVTCVAVAARTLFAGTENGSILCWKIDAPDQPVVLVRKRDAIVTMKLAKICGIPHLIYSAKDLSVRARVIGQTLETAYESGGAAIGAVDAASDLICATDAHGRRLLVWKATAPSQPSSRVDAWRQVNRPILDVWMSKVRSA